MDLQLQGRVVQILEEQSGEGKTARGESEILFWKFPENTLEKSVSLNGEIILMLRLFNKMLKLRFLLIFKAVSIKEIGIPM